MAICANILDTFGNTPVVKASKLAPDGVNLLNEQNAAEIETLPERPTPYREALQILPGREGQIGIRFEI